MARTNTAGDLIKDIQLLARQAISRGIREIVERTHGTAGFEPRPAFPGSAFITSAPVPAGGIHAAILLRNRAVVELLDQVRAARGQGMSWERIAAIPGVLEGGNAGESPAERAFYLVAPQEPDSFRPSYTTWCCATCDRSVTDRGPFEAHPANNESGHAEDCARLAAEVEQYRREWGEDT
ncbi:MAG TPA: hypothetical protein VJ914_40290 [Pseudonocardiaceae bacterium]|nr:hypothetical protein [Pseudonocardiaceae bacterium]